MTVRTKAPPPIAIICHSNGMLVPTKRRSFASSMHASGHSAHAEPKKLAAHSIFRLFLMGRSGRPD
jgi:hypothetical protein